MAKDPRSTVRHPDPARPDDPMIPNPGDPYPGHPDPAYPSPDHPAPDNPAPDNPTQAQAGQAARPPRQPAKRPAGASVQQQADQMAASPFGDPSPGDENPRDLPLPAASATPAKSRAPRKRKGKGPRQQTGQDMKGRQPQQSGGVASPFGDPSPGDENPRPIEPRGPQRS